MNTECEYIPYKPTPEVVIKGLRRACVLAETEKVGKRVVFSAFKIDSHTNNMVPLILTINVGSTAEVQFAKNLAEELERRKLDRTFSERFDRLLEWMGALG